MAALRFSPIALRPNPSPAPPHVAAASSLRATAAASHFPSLRLSPRRRGRRGTAPAALATGSAAENYAAALAEVAEAKGTLDQTVADLEKLERLMEDAAIADFFDTPTVPVEEKDELVEEIIRSSELQPHVANFLRVVVEMRRAALVPQIVKEFDAAYNRMTGTEVAVVSSVVQLESQDLAQIAQAVQKLTGARNVRVKTRIDPDLIAGFTVNYGSDASNLIDMSVRKQIEEIYEELQMPEVSLSVATA